VKLMTVHQAKGLEFAMVAIAGLAAGTGKDGGSVNGIFPSSRVENPLNARALPYELREDAAWLPRWAGSYKPFKAELGQRASEDERRLFYVAVTRAKRLLLLTAAWWYRGADAIPKGPSPFWREAVAHPTVRVLVEAEQPEASPLADRLAQRRAWPPTARRREEVDDPVFPEGYAAAVALARQDPDALTGRLRPDELPAYHRAHDAQRRVTASVAPPVPAVPAAPKLLSVAQVLTYARCPRAFYWSVVRPLPAEPRSAARFGTLVHRLLEHRARGTELAVPDLGGTSARTGSEGVSDPGRAAGGPGPGAGRSPRSPQPPGPGSPGNPSSGGAPGTGGRPAGRPARRLGGSLGELPEEQRTVAASAGVVERATGNFEATRFAALPPPEVEVEVALRRGDWVVRGRIDAVYDLDGAVEVVDWNTGAVQGPPGGDGLAGTERLDQLGLYALALRGLGRLPGNRCRVTYCYLGAETPRESSRELGPAELDQQQALLDEALAGIGSADWSGCGEPTCEVCGRRR
jgi:DNA helicase-2/ATP-dependent DNA helicase PcrA